MRARTYYLTVQLGHLYLGGCAPQTSQVEDMVVCELVLEVYGTESYFFLVTDVAPGDKRSAGTFSAPRSSKIAFEGGHQFFLHSTRSLPVTPSFINLMACMFLRMRPIGRYGRTAAALESGLYLFRPTLSGEDEVGAIPIFAHLPQIDCGVSSGQTQV